MVTYGMFIFTIFRGKNSSGGYVNIDLEILFIGKHKLEPLSL